MTTRGKFSLWIKGALWWTSLISLLALGGCGTDGAVSTVDQQAQAFADLRESVRQSIGETDRRKEALAIVDELELVVTDFTSSLREHRSSTLQLYSDYDATREDLMALAQRSDLELANYRRRSVELLQSLNAVVSAEERKAIGKAETKAMKAISKSLSNI